MGIQALASDEASSPRRVAQTQGVLEEFIAAKPCERLEITVAETQQGNVGHQHVAMLDRVHTNTRDSARPIGQVGMMKQCLANESKNPRARSDQPPTAQ